MYTKNWTRLELSTACHVTDCSICVEYKLIVIARSDSDKAIPRIGHFTWDCFVAIAPRNDIIEA
ncbi:MAG: hypothetical protein FWC80_01520 [Firmicutes bacterium]|nr:hypothetical protein [Bacillota bacterium]